MRLLLIGLLSLLASCAGPRITGNERGGVIPWFATNTQRAFERASAHCATYGKTARITSIQAEAGGHALFECQ